MVNITIAAFKIKSYKMDAIFRYADYYIDNLDELELDLIPDIFFEKFKEDLDWTYITTTKLLDNNFIIKFADVIDIDELCKFYPCDKTILSFFIEKQISFPDINLILNCNIDLEGLALIEDYIADFLDKLKIKLDQLGIDIRTHEVASLRFKDFPNDIYAKYMLKEIERTEIRNLLFEGMQDCFKNAFLRKYRFRQYKPLWEPEEKIAPLENAFLLGGKSAVFLSSETRILKQQKIQ